MSAFKFLLLGLLLEIAQASPVNPASEQRQSFSLIKNLTDGPPRCTHSPQWTSPSFDASDCWPALERFITVNVTRYGAQDFEFLGPSAIPSHTISTVQTPIKVTHESCTMVIAMLDSFPQGTLPGGSPQQYPPTDITSYSAIRFTAFGLMQECTIRRELPGWSPTGSRDSIGIFFWAKDSSMNRRLRGGRASLWVSYE